jgi:hypothetical protein
MRSLKGTFWALNAFSELYNVRRLAEKKLRNKTNIETVIHFTHPPNGPNSSLPIVLNFGAVSVLPNIINLFKLGYCIG